MVSKMKGSTLELRMKIVLGALIIFLGGVLEPSSVLDGDGLALGRLSAGTRLNNCLNNTHFC